MIKKRILFFITFLVALLSIEFAYIYVPEKFEGPLVYRVQTTLVNSLALMARIFGSVQMGLEPVLFRNYLKILLHLLPPFQPKNESDLSFKDILIDDVTVRVYTPKHLITENKMSPAIIYFHGGGFIIGSIDSFHPLMYALAENLNYVVISVDYKLAPENPYPSPVNDGLKIVNHIIENPEKFRINIDQIIFAGDSAGGNIVAVLTQKFAKINKKIPKIQVLIYPWLQLFNIKLPSYTQYRPNSFLASLTFSVSKVAFWYLGESQITDEMHYIIESNAHIYAIDDENTRKKYSSYVDLNLIPSEYKIGKYYYENYDGHKFNQSNREIFEKIINKENNQDLKKKLVQLFNPDFSPGLVDDSELKNLPKSYFIILEWDSLKDEGLIYSERLRLNNCSVTVGYYENAFHGILPFVDTSYGYKISKKIFDDLINYLKANI